MSWDLPEPVKIGSTTPADVKATCSNSTLRKYAASVAGSFAILSVMGGICFTEANTVFVQSICAIEIICGLAGFIVFAAAWNRRRQ